MAPPKKKNKMKLFHFSLNGELLSWLTAEAERRNIPKAELIRIALCNMMAKGH